MLISRRAFRSLACLAAIVGLNACGPSSTPEAPADDKAKANAKQLVFLGATTIPPFALAQQQALTLLTGRNKSVTLQTFDAQNNPGKQVSQWQAAIASKPFAIIVQAVDPNALAPYIKDAVASNCLVIGLGKPMLDTGCSTVVWCDQRELGRIAGQTAVRALTLRSQEAGKTEITGRVVQIRGDEVSFECVERNAGFLEALRAAPGVVVVHDAPGGWTQEGGSQRTQDALKLQGKFDVVYAHNDLMALGAAKAAGDQRDAVLIIGTDAFGGATGGMTLVGSGDIDASVFQPLLVDFAWSVVRKQIADPAFKPKPSYQLIPRAISAKDIDEIRRNGLPKFPPL